MQLYTPGYNYTNFGGQFELKRNPVAKFKGRRFIFATH
jgi:hypothetical protein